MAKPTKPKTLKPKASEAEGAAGGPAGGGAGAPGGEGQSMDMMKFIILIVVTLLVGLGGPAASMYFLGPMVLVPAIQEGVKAAIAEGGEGGEEGEGEGEAGAEHEGPGMNLELDEFTIALKNDPSLGGTQYLRAKMALSVHVPPEQDCHAHAAEAAGGGEGGGHGGGGGGGADPCQEAFNKSMSVYVPGIRDIINTALMKQTATALSSVAGQEVLKDNIKNDVNNLMVNSGYEVMRVNFQDFIVQR